MFNYVYALNCQACGNLDKFDFKFIKELSLMEWAELKKELEKKDFLCSICLAELDI